MEKGVLQRAEDGSLTTFTILTGKPNELVAPVHDRIPVIVRPELYDLWLDPGARPDALAPVLEPFPASEMEAYPVGTRVNSPRNDDAGLIERVLASPS